MSNPAFPAVTPDIYGPLIGAPYASRAMLDTIQAWSPWYIAEVGARFGITDVLVPFEHWDALYDVRAMPAGLTAACWVSAPNTDPKNPPELQGDGTYWATWLVDANIVARGLEWDQTGYMLQAYALAVRSLVVQHRSLGGLVTNTAWQGEGYKEIEHTARRTTGYAVVRFAVKVNGVTSVSAGPRTLPTSGPPATDTNPTIDDVTVTIQKTGVD